MNAECPIVRDGIINGRINRAFVRVVDNSSASDVSCILFSRRSDGVLHQVSTPRASAGANTFVQTLPFTALQAANNGYYHLSCSIPPGGSSRIVSYQVEEEN